MKKKEMHGKSSQQLEKHADKLAKQLAELQTNLTTKREKNVRQVRQLKRERARALTIASERAGASEETKSESEEK